MNHRSLTFRLVAWYCGLLLVVGGSFAVYTYVGFSSYLQAVMRDTLAARSQDAAALARSLLRNPETLAAAISSRFEPEVHDRFMRISLDGRQLYVSGEPLEHRFDPRQVTVGPQTDGSLRSFGDLWVYTRAQSLPGGHKFVVETGQLDVLLSAAQRGLVVTLLSALPVLLCIAAYGGYRLVGKALLPVAGMINAAEAITFNSPSKRLPAAGTSDVIDELGHTLNRMLERLDGAYQHASKFSADAAHELRTPLAIMRGELEFIAGHADVSAEAAAAIVNALGENIRLGQIVDSLVTIAVIDSEGGQRAHLPVELRTLAVETIEQMRLLAEDKCIALTCQDGAPVVTLADRARLKQVLVNLIDNAIKYTGSGGSVQVLVGRDHDSAVLAVSDTGIGIAPEHQGQVFERFFRVSPERGADGAGLGLAITRSICAAHGGSVDIESALGRGSTFRVRLPLAPPGASTLSAS